MNGRIQKSHRKIYPSVIAGIALFAIALAILALPLRKNTSRQIDLSEYSSISTICELATLKSFYHNIVVYEKEPGDSVKVISTVLLWPFDKLAKTGYKQFWIEYSGVVETGIDASKIQINNPDANGVVEVYIPDAEILSVYADENSLSKPLTEKGLFTTITGEEQAKAFAKAQSAMREEAAKDQVLLKRAKNNAKILLKQYIKNTGLYIGIDYSVKWINSPK